MKTIFTLFSIFVFLTAVDAQTRKSDSLSVDLFKLNPIEYALFEIYIETNGIDSKANLKKLVYTRQVIYWLNYMNQGKGIPINQVLSPADYRVGITTKHDEYYERIKEAFNTIPK